MVEYIYEEKRRTHAVGLSLSRTHESYVKALLTNKPYNPRCTIATCAGTRYVVECTFVGIVSSCDNLIRRS